MREVLRCVLLCYVAICGEGEYGVFVSRDFFNWSLYDINNKVMCV